MAFDGSAAALLADTHARLLRLLSAHTGQHFSGLAVAARRTPGILPNQVVRRLQQLDIAHNIVRHVTLPSCTQLVLEVQSCLCGGDDIGGVSCRGRRSLAFVDSPPTPGVAAPQMAPDRPGSHPADARDEQN